MNFYAEFFLNIFLNPTGKMMYVIFNNKQLNFMAWNTTTLVRLETPSVAFILGTALYRCHATVATFASRVLILADG